MTIATATRGRKSYVATGANSTYIYDYMVFDQTHLSIEVVSPAGVIYPLTLSTDGSTNDYTVSGVGTGTGGVITLLNNSQAWITAGKLTLGWTIVILRTVPLSQTANLRGEGGYNPETNEQEMDLLTMALQQVQDALDRCVKIPDVELGTSFTMTSQVAALRANTFLAWDSNGNLTTSAGAVFTAMTPGRVLFPGANGLPTGSSSFFWDNTNLIHSTKGAVSPGGIDLRARTSANDGMPNFGDASIVGDGWMRIYGHGTNEFMDLSYYKYGSTITVRNLRGSAGAECALEIHGWNGTQPTAIVTFVRAVNATPDYCDIQVRNPTDTDGLALFMYASGAEIYPITATTMKLGVATTPYAEFQTDKFNLKSTTVLGWLNGAVLSGTATTAAVDCSIARSAAGLLNINGGTDPGSINKGMTLVQSSVGGIMGLYIQNTDNTNATSHAEIWLQNGGNSGGNAFMRFTNQGVIDWTSGLKRTTNNYHFSVSNTLGTADTLVLAFGGAVQIANIRANGQNVSIESVTELTTIAAAATTDTAIQIPANAVVLGVSVRNTVAIPTAVTYTVTGTSSGTVFNTVAVPVAISTTDPGTKAGAFYNATAQTIRITPSATPGTNVGRVRVTIHYYLVTAPTS